MKPQTSLSMTGYSDKDKKTRREQFLAEMDQVVPWTRLYAVIEPHYPKGSPKGGRPPLPLARMFRIYCLQKWYNLSDGCWRYRCRRYPIAMPSTFVTLRASVLSAPAHSFVPATGGNRPLAREIMLERRIELAHVRIVLRESIGGTITTNDDVLRRDESSLSLIHISEPTRQAEISYAVFCLKK